MGFKFKAFVVLWSCFIGGVRAQCTEDSQCPEGYYCEVSAAHCHRCLVCDDYKRAPPLQGDVCVKSILQCGACFEGLVEDPRMEHACVAPLGTDAGGALPTYVWAVIGLAVLGLALVAIVYVVFKKDTLFQYILKIRATTSVHSTCGATDVSPSAPELGPPPYDELYAPPAPAAPPAPPHASHDSAQVVDEDARPFIKRVPSTRARGARESADSQAARPYNKPAYIRGPHTSYSQSDESEPASPPFTPHDEDTMESLWTPNENANNAISNSNSSAAADGATSAGAAAAGEARAHEPDDEGPPAKTLCVREDSNNNRGRESSSASAHSHAGSQPTVLISVVNNFTSFEQRNNLNLPRH